MNLQHKVAWITGGARMGEMVAKALAHSGCRIVLTYRHSKKSADQTARMLKTSGHDVLLLRCDLSENADLQKTAQAIVRHFKRLDILVNLASMYERTPLSNSVVAMRGWNEHMTGNAGGAYHLSRAVFPHMKASGGRIIHVSDWTSASGRPRYKDFSAYYVSKAAIKAVVEALALEFAPKVLINAIAPGPMIPPPDLSIQEYDAVIKATPLARWGGAEELAKAVLFLVHTDFVTGETIRVDGGRHLS